MKVNIPNPCTENYDSMSPTELGRLCNVCNTEVVDFSNWETKDIVNYIHNSNKKVCGKMKTFDSSKNSAFKKWGRLAVSLITIASTITLANGSDKTYFNLLSETTVHTSYLQDSIILEFIDKHGEHLPYVNLINTKTNHKFLADKFGKIAIPYIEKSEFKIIYLGFETKIIQLNKSFKKNSSKTIILKEVEEWIGEVVVVNNNSFKQKFKRLLHIFSIRDDN